MRLLLFTYEFPPLIGGIGRYCRTLVQGLVDQGHEVLVLIPREIEGADGTVCGAQVRCLPQDRSPLHRFVDAYRLCRAIQTYQPDYVLATHGFSFVPVGLLGLIRRFPYALTIIGSDVQHHASVHKPTDVLWRFLFQRALNQAQKLICISRYSRDLLRSTFSVPAEGLHVVYMGLDEPRFARPSPEQVEDLRQRLHLRDQVVLLTVGRLVPRKGHDQVLRALAQLISTHPTVHYLVVGEGPDERRLRRMVTELGLEAHVTFAGYVPEEELNHYYDVADVYVMPSRPEGEMVEGFGLVFIEAGARGLPVVGGRHGGVREAVLDGQTGYLVDPLAPDEIARRISELIERPELRRMLGEHGRKRALSEFTAHRMVENTIEVLLK